MATKKIRKVAKKAPARRSPVAPIVVPVPVEALPPPEQPLVVALDLPIRLDAVPKDVTWQVRGKRLLIRIQDFLIGGP